MNRSNQSNQKLVHKKVVFNNNVYWLHELEDISKVNGHTHNISPLNHYDENGELTDYASGDISYAIIQDDRIMRFSNQIGMIDDLIDLTDVTESV